MEGKIMLRIENRRDFVGLYWKLVKNGLMKGVSVNDMNLPADRFPLDIPIELDALIELAGSPACRPFRKRIDECLCGNLRKVIAER